MKINTPEPEPEPEPEPLKNTEDEIFKFDDDKPVVNDDEAVVNNEPFKEPVKPRPKKPRSAKQIAHLEKMRLRKAQVNLERNADKVEMKRIKDAQKEEKRLLKEQNKTEREQKIQEQTIEVLEKRSQLKKEKPLIQPRDNFEDFISNYTKMKEMERFFLEKNKQQPVKETKKEPVAKQQDKPQLKPQLKPQDFGFGMSYKKNNRRRYF